MTNAIIKQEARGKAVADGAVSFLVDHFISARVAKCNFGVEVSICYNENNREHQDRSGTVYTDCDGYRKLPEGFHVILAKASFCLLIQVEKLHAPSSDSSQGTRVLEITPFRQSYNRGSPNKSEFYTVTQPILVYRGTKLSPQWVDEEPGMCVYVRLAATTHWISFLCRHVHDHLYR